ncbi:uncharacterized protein LOC130957120 [Arachis stenosperma]|uniref:uncharacterized protein LOC130957120 n=1 Tax=Arachis stenosperma TaxID=217475 RepID=UPI0025AC2482|nr:uncharacterized protein LOC130957120 [Arachis stenosperma]
MGSFRTKSQIHDFSDEEQASTQALGTTYTVEHPQINGQVEAANRVLLQTMKKKFSDVKGEWANLIPKILWSYNTTIQSATGETLFKLVYGAEAMIPVEVSYPTLRAELYNHNNNTLTRTTELDLADEDREVATIK